MKTLRLDRSGTLASTAAAATIRKVRFGLVSICPD